MSGLKKVTWVAVVLFLYVTLQYSKVVNVLTPYDSSYLALPKLDYEYLANQDTDPFLFHGQVVDQTHPQWRRYKRAISRYTDVRECLVKSEWKQEHPNLSLFDWKRVGTGRGAEVCSFRIAASLGTIERLMQWMDNQNFRHGRVSRTFSSSFTPQFETQAIYSATASWNINQYRVFKPSWLHSLFRIDLVDGYALDFNFDQHFRVSGVNVSQGTIFN